MNTHLNELIELANNDKAIDSFNPQIEAADKKLARAEKKIKTSQDIVNTLTTEIADNETKVVSFDEQLKMLNEQLLLNVKKTKEITNEKEMKALSLEEDIAKEKITFANEEIERLQGINSTKSILCDEEAVLLKEYTAKFNEINKIVSAEKAEIDIKKATFFEKRQELSRKLEQKVLAFYEKIRIWAGNTAVVPVKKQACYGCCMKLNDKTYSEVIKADEICNCPHCGRILYIEPITDDV